MEKMVMMFAENKKQLESSPEYHQLYENKVKRQIAIFYETGDGINKRTYQDRKRLLQILKRYRIDYLIIEDRIVLCIDDRKHQLLGYAYVTENETLSLYY